MGDYTQKAICKNCGATIYRCLLSSGDGWKHGHPSWYGPPEVCVFYATPLIVGEGNKAETRMDQRDIHITIKPEGA